MKEQNPVGDIKTDKYARTEIVFHVDGWIFKCPSEHRVQYGLAYFLDP